MDLKKIVEAMLDGNCILFTGSGFSRGATNIQSHPLGTATWLIKEMLKECDIDDDGFDLEEAVDYFLDKRGEQKLVDFLKEQFSVNSISDSQKYIGSIPWKRIYTTNYDNVIDLAYKNNDKYIETVTLSDSWSNYRESELPMCIHLNGSITRLNRESLQSEFKLTNVSYLTTDFVDSEWLKLFHSDLATSDYIVFIGFSLKYDLDLKRVFFNPNLYDKCFFIVSDKESDSSIRSIKKFGTPVPIGLESFTSEISRVQATYIRSLGEFHTYSFKKNLIRIHKNTLEFRDSIVYDLYTKGDISSDIVFSNTLKFSNFDFLIRRDVIEDIQIKLKEASTNNIVVHSDFGNGKSVFLKMLSAQLALDGYSVFEYAKFSSGIYREIEKICKSDNNKIVIIIDNYSKHFDLLDHIALHRDNAILILSERTVINDLTYEKLEERFGELFLYDLNKLQENEIIQLIEILDSYGFWKDKSHFSHDLKVKHITKDCNSELRSVLMELLESSDMLKRFNNVISDIHAKKGYYESFIFILVSNIYGFELELMDLGIQLGYDKMNSSAFLKDRNVLEFINFDKGEIVLKSSVLAQSILEKIVDSKVIVDTLLSLFHKLDNLKHYKPYRNMLKSLMSYASLRRILNTKDENSASQISRFFEGVRNTSFCKSNTHFWLQYAIERLSARDYERAEMFFKTAYSYAKKIEGYNTYQIDNHYARYIFENIQTNGDVNTCMEDFLRAHKILMESLYDEDVKYYPYRVARNYYPFYDKFFQQINKQEQNIFLKSCDEMLGKMEVFIRNYPHYGKRRDVLNSKEKLNTILRENNLNT